VAVATAGLSPEEKLLHEAETGASPSSVVSGPDKQSFLKKLLARRQPEAKVETSQPAVKTAPAVAPAAASAPVVVAETKAVAKAPPVEPVVWKVTSVSMQDVRTTADQSVLALKKVSARPVAIQCDLAARPDLVRAKSENMAAPKDDAAPKYAGEWRDGEMNGQGSLAYPGGAQYVGQWKANFMDGLGQFIDPSGWQYVGEWRGGAVEGDGILTHPDGWKYAGQWHDGKRNGQGKVVCSDGWEYVGGWSNGWMQGEGRLTLPKVGAYVGEWRDGKQEGQGTFTYLGDAKIRGAVAWRPARRTWSAQLSRRLAVRRPVGERHSRRPGTLTHPDGWTYTGQWRNGKMDGQGELTSQKKTDPTAK